MESHFQSQKEIYEKEIEGLNFKVEHLSQDINHLQKLFREENDINDGIRLEVSRLTSENLVRSRCGSTTQMCLWHSKYCGHVFEISRLKQLGPCKMAHPWGSSVPAGVVCKETATFIVWVSSLLEQPHRNFLPFHLHKPDLRFFSEAFSKFWGSPHQRAAMHSKTSYRQGWRAWQLVLCKTVWHKELMVFQKMVHAISIFWKIIEEMFSKQNYKNRKYKENYFLYHFFLNWCMECWGVFFPLLIGLGKLKP